MCYRSRLHLNQLVLSPLQVLHAAALLTQSIRENILHTYRKASRISTNKLAYVRFSGPRYHSHGAIDADFPKYISVRYTSVADN